MLDCTFIIAKNNKNLIQLVDMSEKCLIFLSANRAQRLWNNLQHQSFKILCVVLYAKIGTWSHHFAPRTSDVERNHHILRKSQWRILIIEYPTPKEKLHPFLTTSVYVSLESGLFAFHSTPICLHLKRNLAFFLFSSNLVSQGTVN